MKKKILGISVLTVTMLTLTGCGGGSSTPATAATNNTTANTGTAYYVDSAVIGVNYICGSQKGVTGDHGSFIFEKGKGCTFYLGNTKFKEIDKSLLEDGKTIIEEDLTVAALLQSLDVNGNPKDDITIKKEVVEAMAKALSEDGKEGALPQTQGDLEALVASLEQVKGYAGHAVSQSEAKAHLQYTQTLYGNGGSTHNAGAADSTNSETHGTNTQSTSNKDIFEYKGLQWQDDASVKNTLVMYAERKNYCESLTLGGYTDWRLPTLVEFKQLNEVKEKLNFAWSNEHYIYWTATEYEAGGEKYIAAFNLSNGLSPQFHINLIKPEDTWGERCVRGEAPKQDISTQISETSKMKDIFQHFHTKDELANSKIVAKASAKISIDNGVTLYLSQKSHKFNYGTSEYSVNGEYEMPSSETIGKGETLLILKQGDNVLYRITYLGAYKTKNIFVRIENPIQNKTYIGLVHPYSGNYDSLIKEAEDQYSGLEDMYKQLFN